MVLVIVLVVLIVVAVAVAVAAVEGTDGVGIRVIDEGTPVQILELD